MKPISRDNSLKELSREHHQALLLCWKIRTGLAKSVNPERIKKYCDWFYSSHLIPHFEMEEKHLFPIAGNNNELVKQAQAEHRSLHILFHVNSNLESTLNLIQQELEKHVRFEERVLFNEIQSMASPEELQKFETLHSEVSSAESENTWPDEFWL